MGLYHLAWEVDTLAELERLAGRLAEAGALVGASDHGTTKSLYGHDPDGLEFEVAWVVPADLLDDQAREARKRIGPLDIEREKQRYGADTRGKLAVSVLFVIGNGDDAEAGPLPEVVVLDLGNGDVEFPDAVFDAPEHHPLLFQRPGAGNVELDGKMADDHWWIGDWRIGRLVQAANLPILQSSNVYAETAIRSTVNTSITSPTFTSLYFSNAIPHSNPTFTSPLTTASIAA